MNTATWVVENCQILLKKASGERVVPPAIDIFRAIFGRLRVCADEAVRSPLDDISSLTFSRAPAQPAVRLSGSDGRNLRLTFGHATDAGFVRVHGESDQLIHDGRWYAIRADLVRAALDWLEIVGVQPDGLITVGDLVALRAQKETPFAVFDEVIFDAAKSVIDEPRAPIAGFSGVLYPYQLSGVAFLSLVAEQGVGCILGDEMGLGKTAQVIALLQIEKNAGRGPALVVAPATLLENWRREFASFAPTLTVSLHAGAGRAGISARLQSTDVILVSYDTAMRDEEILSQIAWNVIVLDEAQAIKNPEAQRTVTVKRLPRRVSIAVTGTPLENRIDDLWSLADFAMPGLLGGRNAFLSQFGNEIEDAVRLAPIVAPMLLRRKVMDVAQDLPERIEVPQALQMPLHLAQVYEALRKRTLEEFGPTGGLVATTRLRMLCAHPLLVGSWHADPSIEMPKYERTVELLEEIFSGGEKALIFSTYQAMANLFMSDMPRRFPKAFFDFIDGRVEGTMRQTVVDRFFEHRGYGVLFLNPKAAGSGLNITTANHVIHYNPEWNPALTAQASARSYRRKQTRPVTIHHLFYVQTVEDVIRSAAAFKQDLAREAVTGHEGDIDPMAIAQALHVSPLTKKWICDQ
ncbi:MULTISPECIES: DEAD/DEAH box helicase [Burkholderia]|uniref:DEAD/DEAH box helicase n=1 Tax=Burkholderia TaxID=32008 RepID=UPI000B7ADAFF|nr:MULTISPECIES: DEAD/DEAH box helicase [Burkholderia]OXJ06529.1 serine/threonine protein phosphatase [Burkholderia sp. AU33803]PRD87840.1 ATP-dependent helicase [Burkholderia contaminans]